MEIKIDVMIIGGGLAGLTAGIHLSKSGLNVTLIEKNDFPKHKVCGEYISNEVLPYLDWLGLNIEELHPTKIAKVEFSAFNGKKIIADLPLGGFGISRYTLDDYLCKKAISNNCNIIQDSVESIAFEDNEFTITTLKKQVYKTEIVIGAFGKRSNIDQKLNRKFIQKKSPWLAVKAHYSGNFSDDLVGLHNFEGGYCGVSKVENNKINICYLADFNTFKKYKNIEAYQKEVVCKNPNLNTIFENTQLLFEKPLTISQISFDKKPAVENHILMVGDSAGLIHPLCGNGMAMAIHSAKIVSELICAYYKNEINSRAQLEKKYLHEWNTNFKRRLRTGSILSYLLQKTAFSVMLMQIVTLFPFLLDLLIRQTHGKPIN